MLFRSHTHRHAHAIRHTLRWKRLLERAISRLRAGTHVGGSWRSASPDVWCPTRGAASRSETRRGKSAEVGGESLIRLHHRRRAAGEGDGRDEVGSWNACHVAPGHIWRLCGERLALRPRRCGGWMVGGALGDHRRGRIEVGRVSAAAASWRWEWRDNRWALHRGRRGICDSRLRVLGQC